MMKQERKTSKGIVAYWSLVAIAAVIKAKPGQAVLLSPASASFDEFTNYEERGERFAEIVQSFNELSSEESTVEEIE